MAEYPALPLFTDAYMADTRHLTAAQHGAYLLLLMTAWRMPDCKLPNDDKFLSRCAAMDLRTWKANRDAVMAFWSVDDEQKCYQRRLLDERKFADDMKRKNSIAGKASALKRKNRHSTTVATKTQPNSNPHTHTHLKDDIDKPISSKRFEEFWKAYPRREGKKAAEKAYMKAKADHATIIKGLEAAKRKWDDPKFIPHAATWLNGERWQDEQAPDKSQPTADGERQAYEWHKKLLAKGEAGMGYNIEPEYRLREKIAEYEAKHG